MNTLVELLLGDRRISWFGALALASELLALLTIPSVLLQRQGRPRAALSWLLALFALPALGVLLWWALGRTSLQRKRRRRAESTREFMERYGPPHSEPGTPFEGLLPPRALGDSMFPSTGNRVDLLLDGATAFPALEAAVRGARRTLHVVFYIFRDDATGRRFRDLLAEKAREGVTVRVLVDAWGTPRFTGKFSDPLRAAGARVAAFLPSRFQPLLAPRLNFVNHRKAVVVDEEIALVGGMNIGDEYAHRWRDVMVRIEGPAASALDHVFLDDWYFTSDDDVGHREHGTRGFDGPVACAVVASGPDRESYLHDAYFNLFTGAQGRVWIVTPYFIPTDALLTALLTAAGRGVDVRIVVPETSDVVVAKLAARSYYTELLAAGVRIFEYEGAMLHAKAILVDDDISAIGSANVDTRSFRLSFEVGCVFKSQPLAKRLSDWYGSLLEGSHAVTLAECESRSTGQKLLESAAHLLSPML